MDDCGKYSGAIWKGRNKQWKNYKIIRYIDDTTLEKSNDKKKDKQESASTISEEVQEFVNLTITEHMGKAYSE